jgi:integrase
MKRRKNPFPGVTSKPDRHGKIRHRFRAKGVDTYLPGPYGSAEFRAAYEAALDGARHRVRSSAAHGTLAWVVERYLESPKYRNLSDTRKRSLRGQLDWLRKVAGDLPFAKFEPQHVEALMARKAGPTAANAVRKNVSLLATYAAGKLGLRMMNPARAAERMKENPDGYHTWTEAEVARYLAHHGPGTKARLALLLFYCTGASRQDAARLGWQNVEGDRIRYRRGKTGIGADLPILPELADELRHQPADAMLFLTHGSGRPYKPETLGGWFKDQCRAAGLFHCSAHGLRKAGATRLADYGASENEIAAFLAHKDTRMASIYTRKRDRARLGMARLPGPNREQKLSNLPVGLDKSSS